MSAVQQILLAGGASGAVGAGSSIPFAPSNLQSIIAQWTRPVQPMMQRPRATASGVVVTDPSFSSVVLLCHFDGTNGSTTYTNSAAPKGNTPSPQGSSSLTTTGPLFGSACLAVTTSSPVVSADSTDYQIGTGDFTVEFAVYLTTSGTAVTLFDFNNAAANGFSALRMTRNSSNQFTMFTGGSFRITGGTHTANTWQRIALSRISGVTRLFVDGTQAGSNYTDTNSYSHGQLTIGANDGLSGAMIGNMDEFRLTVGVGRYSGTYTVAAAAFPDS